MLRRLILILPLLWSGVTLAAEVTDSTGRAVQVPDQIRLVLPAGPAAAILLEVIAPDLMAGFYAVVYGHALTPGQLDAVLGGVHQP
jgi:iron complex transport system substrate-binding protein